MRSTARRLLDRQRRIMAAHAEAAARGKTVALRKFRGALRRSRVLLKALRKPLSSTGARQLRKRLSRLDNALGASRDIDVMLELFTAKGAPRAMVQRIRAERIVLRRRLRKSIRKEQWAHTNEIYLDVLGSLRSEYSIRTLASKKLAGAVRKMRALHRDVKLEGARRLHRFRIATRRVYLLASLFENELRPSPGLLAAAARACARPLGRAHDAAVASKRVARLGGRGAGPLLVRLDAARHRAMSKFYRRWPALAEISNHWKVRR